MSPAARAAVRSIGTPLLTGVVLVLLHLDHLRVSGGSRPLFIFALVALAGVASVLELYRLMRLRGLRPDRIAGSCALLVLLAGPIRDASALRPTFALYLLVVLGLYSLARVALMPKRFSITDASATITGALYVGMLWFVYDALRFGEHFAWYLVFLLGASKFPDQAGYIAGKLIGRHPMAPTLSPNKTWEGGIAGFLAGFAGGLALLLYTPAGAALRSRGPGILIALSGTVTIAAVLGDLAESAIKRWAGVKDSGPLPEFGGALDIVDSFLLSGPAAALLLCVAHP